MNKLNLKILLALGIITFSNVHAQDYQGNMSLSRELKTVPISDNLEDKSLPSLGPYSFRQKQNTSTRLKIGVQANLPKQMTYVEQAVTYLLEPTGYRLVYVDDENRKELISILSKPIPMIARDAGLMSVQDALLLVIGEGARMLVDHKNAYIAFEPASK